MPPKSLTLKKGQAGQPKNQKSITQFFKTTNVNNSQKTPEKTLILPTKCDEKPAKRKATSPLSLETPKPVGSCSSIKKDTNKKLKCENQNGVLCATKKSPGKENDIKRDNFLFDFDSLLIPDNDEINENNCVSRNNCTPKKDRSPLVPCVGSNVKEDIVNLLDDDDEIETKNHDTIQCQGKFSPNFYDLNDEDSFEINNTPVKLINGTPKRNSSIKSAKSPLKINKSPGKCAKVLEFNDEEVDCMFDDEWAEDIHEDISEDLDLTIMQRCEIESVTSHPNRLELRLKNSANNRGSCYVDGIWLDTPLQPGDTISILASRDSSGRYSVSNSSGLIVLRPDRLISSTSVVAGVFCKRKAVLQERWRGIDSANSAMTVGILVHELVQKALTHNIKSIDQLRKEADKILQESIQCLYDAGLSEEEACSNMQQYISPLAEFMQMYMSDKPPPNKGQKDRWNGTIDKVLDIEENVCCPQLGLKGKIDATLQVTIHERKGRETALVPLELKSGRASASAEHRGQLVLYGMMLSLQRRRDPASEARRGLLLYLKERVDLREVSCGYPERRDLMMLRNQLVRFLSRGPDAPDPEQLPDIEEASRLLQQDLPDPVNHHNACAKCPYLTVCSLHLW